MKQVVRSLSSLQRRAVQKGADFVAKLCMVIALVSMAINVFIVLTLVQMAPQLKVIAEVVLQDALSSNQTVIAEPFSWDMMDQKKLDEMLVRFYLTNRYSYLPDGPEMTHRWGENGILQRLSTGMVYYSFAKDVKLDRVEQESFTRSIEIKKIERLDNTWTVELDVFTMTPNTPAIQKVTYEVVLETINLPGFAFYNIDFINPYGFRVIDYRQTVKKQ